MQPLAHGYSHDTRSDGATVVKRYQGPDSDVRRFTEWLALSRLAGSVVPVPRLTDEPVGALRMQHISGVHGQELIAAGHSASVLRSCGQVLRQLQTIESTKVFEDWAGPANGTRPVIVHGDYGPNNMLFDPIRHAATAVIDWEWAHPGDPVEDLAWCEWIIRMHHPDVVDHLPELFKAYGERPSWIRRQDAMLAKCHRMARLYRPAGSSGQQRWQQNIDITQRWSDSP